MIRTEGLTKRYDELVAVDDLNIHVEKGEIYGFLGPNGAGKTTTIMMLLGLLRPTQGRILLFDQELQSDYFGMKSRIGVLSEFHYLYDEMRAEEYLRFFCDLYRVENPQRRIAECLERVNLYDRRKEFLGGYSKGMKQKLSLARVLLHDPELLVLDEPVSSLDPHGIKEVRDILIEENRRGKTMFISSHILSEIERTCHRIGIMHKGQLMAEDSMDSLRRRLTEEVEIRIELEAAVEGLDEIVAKLPFVLRCAGEGKKLLVTTKADADYRGRISKAVIDAGGVLLDMHKSEMSLEEAFVTITEKNINLLAKEGPAA